ncbi:MAG: DNA photolyase [Proteobacteria bacterium]|jgi:spore photoproduct lyase|nr:DNA photolyase [Pseudomonadota bacterium]
MVAQVYIEEAVRTHPRTLELLEHYSTQPRLTIDSYQQAFNPKGQNFRLQKQNPSLIIAEKHGTRVHPAPPEYGTGGKHHYYFSHMLNCVYDCRYCFLQGMYRSANYLVFVNYEDFLGDIESTVDTAKGEEIWFYSGYDCDSLAFEPITGFAQYFVPEFSQWPNAKLELRTKSTQIRHLLQMEPLENVIVAFSLNSDVVASGVEQRAPSVDKRLDAMDKLQHAGWTVAARLDPLIWYAEFEQGYTQLIHKMVEKIDCDSLHSVSLGSFRLPDNYFKTLAKLYPEHWLFASGIESRDGQYCYTQKITQSLLDFCEDQIYKTMPSTKVFRNQ